MSLIKLIIMDDDDEYSFNLCSFLTHNYSDSLFVNYCSNSCKIEEWIEKHNPDIILTCEKNYYDIRKKFDKTIILLSRGANPTHLKDIPTIYKYSNINKLAGIIIDNFINSGNIIKSIKEKTAKIVSVYSASGSVGKTTVARILSSTCSLIGLKVFYLNLEQFQFTNLNFSSNNDYSLSDILYYVREKDKNLSTKLIPMRCQDNSSNVFFFMSPNNPFEINDILPEDIEFLLKTLQKEYDLIVIDLDSHINNTILEVFNISDEILYILENEEICLHKTSIFLEGLSKLPSSSNQYTYLLQKIVYVANKVSNQGLPLFQKFLPKEKILSEIPFHENLKFHKFSIMGGPEILNDSFKKIAGRYVAKY